MTPISDINVVAAFGLTLFGLSVLGLGALVVVAVRAIVTAYHQASSD